MLFNLCVHAGGVSNLGFFPFYSVKVNIIYITPLLSSAYFKKRYIMYYCTYPLSFKKFFPLTNHVLVAKKFIRKI